ncbi:MAG: hypothetical protein LBP37_00810 [Spirochaetaceae bacterium]|jgi:hypothetical protein|nr:hypothetical protein [Spirochaetaceae bacterium]
MVPVQNPIHFFRRTYEKVISLCLSAALLLTLSLAGCPQDADDDDDAPAGIAVTPPASVLSYIAYSFGNGFDRVKVINDISLENNELVIPAGKTLELGDFILSGLTDNSKIIIWGDGKIEFGSRQGGALRLTTAPGAKIIADETSINAHVYVDYTYNPNGPKYDPDTDWANIPEADRPGLKEADKGSADYWANWNQVVVIADFEGFTAYKSGTGGEDERGYLYDGKYVAVFAPEGEGNIGSVEVDEIKKKAKGLCFYLVGMPVTFSFSGEINIKDGNASEYYKSWGPAGYEVMFWIYYHKK